MINNESPKNKEEIKEMLKKMKKEVAELREQRAKEELKRNPNLHVLKFNPAKIKPKKGKNNI